MYFMWTSTGGGGLAHVDAFGQREGVKNPIFVDVINGWPLTNTLAVTPFKVQGFSGGGNTTAILLTFTAV